MSEIRKSLGFCPQYDIIYPELTVAQHMQFYGALRGISERKVCILSGNLYFFVINSFVGFRKRFI